MKKQIITDVKVIKTEKDLMPILKEGLDGIKTKNIKMKKNNLKELREYAHTFDDGETHTYVRKDDLKQLVIKWIKEERNIKKELCKGWLQKLTQEERWMKRLNITEEDLK